jgi:xanthine phosphoribosyltransferase
MCYTVEKKERIWIMNFLEERIVKDGVVKEGNVLKVDSFLNHQMDISLLDEIGREFHRRFSHKKVTKVLTIEASGIAIAYPVAKEFGVPMVFAKKSKSINIDGEMYVAEVISYTHKNRNQIIVSKKFINADDHVLIIDDFLASESEQRQVLYIWGHSYQIGVDMTWEDFEEICKKLTSVKDLVFETNKDALLKE